MLTRWSNPRATKTSTDSEAEKWKLVAQTGCKSGKLISVLVTKPTEVFDVV